MQELADILGLYDYTLPRALIAEAPASPRDSARLLLYDRKTKKRTDAIFRDIGTFLPKNAVLVLNETKVIPAKLVLTKASGGQVTVLSLGAQGAVLRVLCNKKLAVGEYLAADPKRGFTVQAQDEKYWLLRPSFPLSELSSLLESHGTMPLPPYIKHTPLSPDEQRREYQSVFARVPGSIAAPTASLHFTEELLKHLSEQGIEILRLTLHVHLGTFAPLTEEQWKIGELHTEEYSIDTETAQKIQEAKAMRRPVIAVGTTVVRTLESAADKEGKLKKLSGSTQLFIREGYTFRLVDGLITNFHVPKSSLLMLVGAFTGREALLDLYRHAIDQKYRFYSFGDAMLIL